MKHFVALISILLIGCKPAAPEPVPRTGKPRVAVVNYPLAYFVERIAGDLVEVHFPAMEGDPAFWKPTGADVRKFQSANLVLLNGASYAKWTGQASLPDSKSVVVVSEGPIRKPPSSMASLVIDMLEHGGGQCWFGS